MEPVPRTLPENFRVIYEWLRRLDRRTQRVSLPPALMPGARLGASVGQVEDLNDAVLTGWYQSPSPSNLNRPPASGSLEIQVVTLESGSVFQTARTHGSAGSPYGDEWVRDYRGSGPGWSQWRPTRLPRTAFNPSIHAGMTVGNGTLAGWYEVSGDLMTVWLDITLGSTSSINGDLIVKYPNVPGVTFPSSVIFSGVGRARLSSSNVSLVTLGAGQGMYIRPQIVRNSYVLQESFNDMPSGTRADISSLQASCQIPLY